MVFAAYVYSKDGAVHLFHQLRCRLLDASGATVTIKARRMACAGLWGYCVGIVCTRGLLMKHGYRCANGRPYAGASRAAEGSGTGSRRGCSVALGGHEGEGNDDAANPDVRLGWDCRQG